MQKKRNETPKQRLPKMRCFFTKRGGLFLAVSFLIALFIMSLCYQYVTPKWIDVAIVPQEGNTREIRCNYIIADAKLINMNDYVQDKWVFNGYLSTAEDRALYMQIPVRHKIELCFPTGPQYGSVDIYVMGEKKTFNLDSESAENVPAQYFATEYYNPFLSVGNMLIGVITCLLCYNIFIYAIPLRKMRSYWGLPYSAGDVFVVIGIPVLAVYLLLTNDAMIHTMRWTSVLDLSGYLAGGKLMVRGLIPYKEIWEHKGPMMFFFNALGIRYWNPYGVWILETALHIVGFYFAYFTLRYRFNRVVSMAAIAFVIGASFHAIRVGDLTESWSLPFLFLASYIFTKTFAQENTCAPGWIVACGAACSVVFFLRANNIVLWPVAIIILAMNQIKTSNWKTLRNQCLCFIAGGLIIALPIFVYFFLHGALEDMIDSSILFNFAYSDLAGSGIRVKFLAIYNQVARLEVPKLGFVLFVGLAYALYTQFGKKDLTEKSNLPNRNIFLLNLGYFCLEVPVAAMSGRAYPHYLLPLIPAVLYIVAHFCEFLRVIVAGLLHQSEKKTMLCSVSIFACVYLLIFPNYKEIFLNVTSNGRAHIHPDNVPSVIAANYIMGNAAADDTYALWGGANAMVILLDDVRPATRFFYSNTNNIMNPANKYGEQYTQLYLQELSENQAKYFVVFHEGCPDIVMQYVSEHYDLNELSAEYPFTLYERRDI